MPCTDVSTGAVRFTKFACAMIWHERLSKRKSTKVNEPILSLKGTNTVASDLGWDRHSLPDIDVIISRPKGPEKALGDKKESVFFNSQNKTKCCSHTHTLKVRLFCCCFDFCLFIDWFVVTAVVVFQFQGIVLQNWCKVGDTILYLLRWTVSTKMQTRYRDAWIQNPSWQPTSPRVQAGTRIAHTGKR